MCFKNLPIEFDAHGQAGLREDRWEQPLTPRPSAGTPATQAGGDQVRDFDIDPVTRVAGALSFHTVVDLEQRRVLEARTEATLFRGYEVILRGREPTDAIHISSRACGVCGGVHASCAAMALEMACGVAPPPLAIIAQVPEYQRVGERRVNLICTGIWDDPESYDATYARRSEWGERRLATPGAVVDGQLRTTRLAHLNLGIEEFVDHSYYQRWEGHRFQHDPRGAPLSPFHPWNKETIPQPTGRNWREKYTWGTAPRWDREAMESGPLARQWITAVAGKLENEFIRAVPGGLVIDLPKGETEAATLHWWIPGRVNALERNRARAYHVAYCGMVAYTFLLKAFEYLGLGRTSMAVPYTIPQHAVVVGFWEAGRGILTHHAVLDDRHIANYTRCGRSGATTAV